MGTGSDGEPVEMVNPWLPHTTPRRIRRILHGRIQRRATGIDQDLLYV